MLCHGALEWSMQNEVPLRLKGGMSLASRYLAWEVSDVCDGKDVDLSKQIWICLQQNKEFAETLGILRRRRISVSRLVPKNGIPQFMVIYEWVIWRRKMMTDPSIFLVPYSWTNPRIANLYIAVVEGPISCSSGTLFNLISIPRIPRTWKTRFP